MASVLQEAGLITGYFDLYTTSGQRMSVHSRFFAGRLGFRDEETARQSIALINRYYQQFALAGDRAGQHHALMMALTMFNRARWTRKHCEAEVFRQWLLARLNDHEIYFDLEPPFTRGPEGRLPKAFSAESNNTFSSFEADHQSQPDWPE